MQCSRQEADVCAVAAVGGSRQRGDVGKDTTHTKEGSQQRRLCDKSRQDKTSLSFRPSFAGRSRTGPVTIGGGEEDN